MMGRARLEVAACTLALSAQVLVAQPVGPAQASAAQGPTEPVVAWSLAAPSTAKTGRPFTATVRAVVKPGWKFYAMTQSVPGPRPLKFEVAGPKFTLDPSIAPDPLPVTEADPAWGGMVSFHDRPTAFPLTLQSAPDSKGKTRLRVIVSFQACSKELCLRPTRQVLEADVSFETPPSAR